MALPQIDGGSIGYWQSQAPTPPLQAPPPQPPPQPPPPPPPAYVPPPEYRPPLGPNVDLPSGVIEPAPIPAPTPTVSPPPQPPPVVIPQPSATTVSYPTVGNYTGAPTLANILPQSPPGTVGGLPLAAYNMLPDDDKLAFLYTLVGLEPPAIGGYAPQGPTGLPDDTGLDDPTRQPAVAVLGPFAGVGGFSDAHPEDVLRGGDSLDWVAIRHGTGTGGIIGQLRDNGQRIVVWEAMAEAGRVAVNAIGAEGYIAQAEGAEQLRAALAIGASIDVPKALVTNVFMSKWPDGWVAMPEAYTVDNPGATVQSMMLRSRDIGAKIIVPILGVYGGMHLTDYDMQLKGSSANSFGIYHTEEMDGQDYAYLKKRKAIPPGPVAAPLPLPAIPPTPPATPPPKPLPGGAGDPSDSDVATVEDAWQELMRVLGLTYPAAADNLRVARRALAAATRWGN